jgi:hypothetical protein
MPRAQRERKSSLGTHARGSKKPSPSASSRACYLRSTPVYVCRCAGRDVRYTRAARHREAYEGQGEQSRWLSWVGAGRAPRAPGERAVHAGFMHAWAAAPLRPIHLHQLKRPPCAPRPAPWGRTRHARLLAGLKRRAPFRRRRPCRPALAGACPSAARRRRRRRLHAAALSWPWRGW